MKLLAVLLVALALAGGAVALSQSSARSSTRAASTRFLAIQRPCSLSASCTRGCALYVARKAPSDSPTTPCASQAVGACSEEVAGAARELTPAAPGRGCAGAPSTYPNRLLPPGARALRPRAEQYFRRRGASPKRR